MAKVKKQPEKSRMTFDIEAPLKRAFKAKVALEGFKEGQTICKLMQAYVDGKIKMNEVYYEK